MAEYKGTIKKWKNSGSIWDILYPKTTIDQVVDLSTTLVDMQDDIEKTAVYYVVGTGTTGDWAGSIPEITNIFPGLVIAYKTPAAGASGGTTLNINGSGKINIRYNHSSNLTTHLNTAGTVVILTYDGTYWQWANFADGTDSYRERWNTSIQVGAITTREKIVMQSNDGKFYPLVNNTTDSIATSKSISQVGFLLNGLIVYGAHTSTISADGTMSTTNNYAEIIIDGDQSRRNLNQQSGWVANRPVFLKGTINSSGLFVLDNSTFTSYMTQTLPTSEDGFVYILYGIMRDTTVSFMLTSKHPAYQYKNGKIRPYQTDDYIKLVNNNAPENINFQGSIGFDNTPMVDGNPIWHEGSLGFASQAEAEAGTNNSKMMNPLTTRQAIDNHTPGNSSDVASKSSWASTDVNHFFRLTNSSAITITIPTDTTINYPISTEIHFMRFGAGEVTIARASGVSLFSEGSASENSGKKRINAQMQVVTIKKVAANTWVLFGALKT